jgi:hypothetical protein
MSEPITSSDSPPATQPDRRAFRRAMLEKPVMIETPDSERPARGLNVSAGGIYLETELSLSVGESVEVYFELPIGYAVETRATVVRCERDRIALSFTDLPKEALIALRSFCRLSGLHPIPR